MMVKMWSFALLISLAVIQLHTVLSFKAAPSYTYNIQDGSNNSNRPISCTSNDVTSRICGRCSDFIQSISITTCCESADVQNQCIKVLAELDVVEELLPAGLEPVDEDQIVADAARQEGGLALLHRALVSHQRGVQDPAENGYGPASGLDLLLEDPNTYAPLAKRAGGLSSKYNRVWWRGPRKRPDDNRVFRNYNRIWWKN